MNFNRRDFLIFLGTSVSTVACGPLPKPQGQSPVPLTATAIPNLNFKPILGVLPQGFHGLDQAQQMSTFATADIVDDLVLPEGFTYTVLAAWGDPVGDSRFGYNNDYLAFVPVEGEIGGKTGANQGFLTMNFEYISALPWQQTYNRVLGKSLPLEAVNTAVKAAAQNRPDGAAAGINAFALPDGNPLKAQIKQICQEALIDLGMGVIGIQQTANGQWQRQPGPSDRRITGISGLTDGRYLKSTGPATLIFRKTQGQGYVDRLGDKIIGTFQNCAGGQTPWGTVLSGEENIQTQVPEPVYADGTAFDPKECPFSSSDGELAGMANVFGLAGNKYGWVVEVDPANPKDFGTKHTWLGRYRHEAVGVRVVKDKPLAFYSGCDRRGGHLYKFVSKGIVKDPKAKANSQLLADGRLYAAQLNADGTGRWLPLRPTTPVQPTPLTFLAGAMLPLPRRPQGGIFLALEDAEIATFQKQFKTLGDLYTGNPAEQQGAILIDAHFAANAAGATCTARPEDTEIGPDGTLYITFTSGSIGKEDGSPDIRIFKGPDGNTAYEYGWIMRLQEDNNDPAALTFRWAMLATGGEAAARGQGFANPDNLVFSPQGHLWMVTDMSSDKMNYAVPRGRVEASGKVVTPSNLRGVFGNNSIWCIPMTGEQAGRPFLFGTAPMDTEATGPCFSPDGKTLFAAIQHPGEIGGTRQDMAAETRQIALRTTDGQEFMQTRKVPIGSNWPGKQPNDPPKPAVVVIQRTDGGAIG
jgi:uncharacterized protein